MKIAYLTFRYPAISQTFVVHEVRGLRAEGFEVETWGLARSDPAQLLTEEYRSEAASTRSLRPIAWGSLLAAHAHALSAHGASYFRTLAHAVRDRAPGARALLLQVAAFGVAIALWRDLGRREVRHLHVHFAGSPTHVAALVARFGNLAEGADARWTWSVSIHGPVEFADLTATHLAARIREALFVVAISDFARSQLLSLLPVEDWDNVHVVRCGIRPGDFQVEGRSSAQVKPLELLYVGRLVALKGQPVLIEALARLRARQVPVRLTIVGDGPERQALERLAERLGVAGQVHFAGVQGQDEVRRLYGLADAFCLPSFAEGVPVVLMEAMAAGLPVVSTRVAGVAELVEHGETGLLVRPGRVDELEEALARLAADPDLGRRMGAAGRARVARDHDARRNSQQLADLHRQFRNAP